MPWELIDIRKGTRNVKQYQGLSTDTRITTDVGNDSSVYLLDTKAIMVYSVANTNPITSDGWWEM